MTAPTIQERLCAAAFSILTDGLPHSESARCWARRTLRASRGRGTAFDASQRGYARRSDGPSLGKLPRRNPIEPHPWAGGGR